MNKVNMKSYPGRGVAPFAKQEKHPEFHNPKPSTPRGKRRREAKK